MHKELEACRAYSTVTCLCAPLPVLLLLLLQGELRMRHWRWDAQDKQTLRIIGLFSIQAVSQGYHVVPHITCYLTSQSHGRRMYHMCHMSPVLSILVSHVLKRSMYEVYSKGLHVSI